MKSILSTIFGLAVASISTAAFADASIVSASQQDFIVTYTLPSGADVKDTLYKGTNALGSLYVPAKPGKPIAVSVSDASGAVIAKGTVEDNKSYLVMPSGKGFSLVYAGLVSQTSWTPLSGIVFVNTLSEEYTIDIAGHSGQSGAKGIKAVASFDPKLATKLSTEDNRYHSTIHLPDGSTLKGDTVDSGSYYVVYKNYEGKVVVTSAGYIEEPPAEKPTKAKPTKKGAKK